MSGENRIEAFQHSVLAFQLCRAAWARWMDAAILAKALDPPDYERRRAEYLECHWPPPRWDWVDPLKDINADTRREDGLGLAFGRKPAS